MSVNQKKRNYAIIFSAILVTSAIGLSIFGLLTTEAYSHELTSFESYESLYNFLKNQQKRNGEYYYPFDETLRMTDSTISMNELSGDS